MERHPAADWAATQPFSPEHIDCTTAVMLKILDGKCKMLPDAQCLLRAIYSVTRNREGKLFDAEVHRIIQQAGCSSSLDLSEKIHRLRLQAEEEIPKPRMKRYKAMLAEVFQKIAA